MHTRLNLADEGAAIAPRSRCSLLRPPVRLQCVCVWGGLGLGVGRWVGHETIENLVCAARAGETEGANLP